MRNKRQYHFCAKCRNPVDMAPGNRSCHHCHGTPGGYTGCAVCGKSWDMANPDDARMWVCLDDLAHPVST